MKVLLVNPWITDFKAYDEWMRPYPFYQLIQRYGKQHEFRLLDCLSGVDKPKKYGTANFKSIHINKPEVFVVIPRKYKRYGISIEEFRCNAISFGKPDLILVTSLMTFWYPGVELAISTLREIYPETPIKLGGVYPTLLPKHASIFTETGKDLFDVFNVENTLSYKDKYLSSSELRHVLPLRIVKGCPDNCSYCSAKYINGTGFHFSHLKEIAAQLDYYIATGGTDVVFYDDAPLYEFETSLKPLLHYILEKGLVVRLHFPNGIHARMINDEVATLLFSAGTKTIRLGFEKTGEKIESKRFADAAASLIKEGFNSSEVGAYLLIGLTKNLKEVVRDAQFINDCGLGIHLNQLSPVPGSEFYKQTIRQFPEIATEPLLQNDMSFIFTHMGFDWDEVMSAKEQIRKFTQA